MSAEQKPSYISDKLGKVAAGFNRPVTRREFLFGVGLVVGGFVVKDYIEAVEEHNSQFELSATVSETLQFMQTLDIDLPIDPLYGFEFPTSREMAHMYHEVLIPGYVDTKQPYKLIIVQERDPKHMMRWVRQLLGIEKRNYCGTRAVVVHGSSKEEPDFLYLAPSFKRNNMAERAITLYHEGLHLWDPQAGRDEEDLFSSENKASIGEMLLQRAYLQHPQQRYLIMNFSQNLADAYDKAVTEGNPDIWKAALLELYGLLAKETPTLCQ